MPVELIIGKVSLGPLANTSFSGSTGIGTISLLGLSLTASGKVSPSVLLPLATMVPSASKVMSAFSPSCGSGSGDALPGGVLVVVPVVPVVLVPVVVPVVPVIVPVVPGVAIV